MKTVQKANKQLRIPDEQLEEVLKRGFSQVDEKTGKVIKADPPAEKALRDANQKLRKENAALKTQVAELTAKLDAAGKAE